MVRAEFAGEAAPEMVAAKTILELCGATYAVRFDGELMDGGIFTFQAGSSAAASLLLSSNRGTNAGRTIPAIFQCVGDRLRICFGFNGVMPVRFVTTIGSELYLASYRRLST